MDEKFVERVAERIFRAGLHPGIRNRPSQVWPTGRKDIDVKCREQARIAVAECEKEMVQLEAKAAAMRVALKRISLGCTLPSDDFQRAVRQVSDAALSSDAGKLVLAVVDAAEAVDDAALGVEDVLVALHDALAAWRKLWLTQALCF